MKVKELCKEAQALGRMARGKKKNYTLEERQKRSDRMKLLNEKRRKTSDRQNPKTQTNEGTGTTA